MFAWLWPPITWRKSVLVLLALWVGIYVVLALANISPPENRCAWAFPKVLSCLLAARENLTGGLIGAGGALIAAWVAWSAIYEQMKEARDIALRRETQTLEYIKSQIEDLLDVFKVVWRIVDDTLACEDRPEEVMDRMVYFHRLFRSSLPALENIPDVEPHTINLGPLHSWQVRHVFSEIRKMVQAIKAVAPEARRKEPDELKTFVEQLRNLQYLLKNLYLNLENFELVDVNKLRSGPTEDYVEITMAEDLSNQYEGFLKARARRASAADAQGGS
jgi:hypothetical protein